MRHLLAFALILVLVGTAAAADLGNSKAVKTNDHVLQNMSFDREGGDSIADAVPIALPFYDTGATCDNTHLYDEVCPYTDSMSPDVVYSFTPDVDMFIDIDLCESLYDTKTFVYDSGMGLVACNDDAGCGITGWQSFLEAVPVMGGMTYYIIIDGYGSDCGDYVISVDEYFPPEPCILTCDGVAEGEPDLVEDYEDLYNGGCNSSNNSWQALTADENGDLTFCGVSGWYNFFGGAYRDTDWMFATIGEAGIVEVTVEAESNFWFPVLESPDCTNIVIAQDVTVGECDPQTLVIEGNPGDLFYFIGLPPEWLDPGMFDYILTFTGLEPGAVATEDASFGSVKALFR